MELAALKKEIHALVDELEGEEALLEVAEILGKYSRPAIKEYEESPEFQQELAEAVQQADNGELHPHDESINWLKNRAWRTQ